MGVRVQGAGLLLEASAAAAAAVVVDAEAFPILLLLLLTCGLLGTALMTLMPPDFGTGCGDTLLLLLCAVCC
jgi:hypothetical protein